MPGDILVRQAIFDFNQFAGSLSASQVRHPELGSDAPLQAINYRQVTREEAVDLFLRVREDLLPYRKEILDSARRSKYKFDNEKWCDVLARVDEQ
jgi:hypothetical protein